MIKNLKISCLVYGIDNNPSQVKALSEGLALKASKIDVNVIVERFVDGEEYTVAIVNNKTLPVIKIKPSNEFYDYEAKYQANSTQYFCPAELSQSETDNLQLLAQQAFKLVGASGWGRVDAMRDQAGQFYLIYPVNHREIP